MGRINLPGGYYIEASAHSYNLYEDEPPKYDKNGKLVSPDAVAFYPSLSAAISGFRKRYGRIAIRNYEGELTLDKAIELLSNLDDEVSGLLKKYHIEDY